MAKKPKAHPEEAAKAVFRISMRKPQDIVVLTNQLAERIKAHPEFSTKPAMQQAVTSITGIAETLGKQETDIQTARAGLAASLATRALTVNSFSRARRSLLAAADEIAAGSAATLKDWGFDAFSAQAPLATSDAPPAGLRVRYNKALVMEVLWKSVPGHRGYAVQIGDGTPEGWGPVIQTPKARFTPTGLAPGQKIAIRVAVQRKSGLSQFSEALSATVR